MKVGDKVKLKKSSKFYYQSPEAIGTITEIVDTRRGWCHVKFDNGYADNYRYKGAEIDLEILKTNFNAEVIKAIKKVIDESG